MDTAAIIQVMVIIMDTAVIIRVTAIIMAIAVIIQVMAITTAMELTNRAKGNKITLGIYTVNKVKKMPDKRRVSGTFFTFE